MNRPEVRAGQSPSVSSRSLQVPVIGPVLDWFRAVRRWYSRSDWGRRLLRRGSPPSDDGDGLVMIQIDGLSRQQLEIALKTGTMPFLQRLLAREGYELQTHYSGVPSTTSAVQAELFFGV